MFRKILAVSDLHLSDTIWKHRPIHGDSYHSWSYIVQYAVLAGVDAVILAGDILDKQLNVANPVAKLNAGLLKLRDAGVTVLYNQGQHEFQRDLPWMDVANLGAKHLKGKSDFCFSNGLRIAGFDYCNEKTLAERLGEIEKDSGQEYFLVCHQVWKDFMGDVGKTQGCFDDLPKNVRFMLTGDFHQTIVREVSKDLTVLSPGSTHLRSLAEPAEKHFFEISADQKGLSIEVRDIPTRRYLEVKTGTLPYLQISERVKTFVGQDFGDLPEELRKPIVRIVHGKDDFDFVRHIKESFDGLAHLFFKLKTVSVDVLSVDTTTDESHLTLQACLPFEINPQGSPAAYGLASELLSGADPNTVLERWLEENLNAN
jgi:DNA repair exonuclease SbcCD nuclease subunit